MHRRSLRLALVLLLACSSTPGRAQPPDPAVNHPLCTDGFPQDQLAGVRDAAGCPVFVWRDFRYSVPYVFAQRLDTDYEPLWAPDGIPILSGFGAQSLPRPVAASDGVIVVWQDARTDTGDVFAARLDPAGGLPWPGTGAVALCEEPGTQSAPLAVSDGAAGAIAAWTDTRTGSQGVYARRVVATGAPLWPAGGVPLRAGAGSAALVALVADGAGGAIAAWSDSRGGCWAQRVDAAGAIQWTVDGVELCQPGPPKGLVAVADGDHGVIAAYEKTDGTGFFRDLYAQRLRADGVRAWPDTGVVVGRAPYFQRAPAIVEDGAGGAIVAWEDSRAFHLAQVFAQRLDSTGTALWTADGVALCGTNLTRAFPAIAADGSGGAIVGWQDDRNGNVDVYAQRVSAAGVPMWTANGVVVSSAPDTQWAIVALPDGAGGATFAWADGRDPFRLGDDLWTQRVLADGSLDTTHTGGVSHGTADFAVALAPPAPNPARRDLRVSWTLPRAARTRVSVHDLQGREVRRLAEREFPPGRHAEAWDLRDARGARVPAGVWLVRVEAEGRTAVRRAITIR